jgi:DDE superfamily endonuclease
VVATDAQATRWHFVCDNLNIHQSETLVCWVAECSGLEEDLGVKGKSGIWPPCPAVRRFWVIRLIRWYSITPPSTVAFLNQIEIWLSILVRKLLKRGSFISVEDLQTKVLAFIQYYNQTMAKPFKWTLQGKALMA